MESKLTRKRFLDTILGIGSFTVIAAIAYPLLKFVNPPKRSSESGEWVDAGLAEDIKAGGFKTIMHASGVPVVVVRRTDEEFVALEKTCPHLGCMVDLENGEMFCPCHGAKFTLDGTRITGPSPRDLKLFKVEIRPDGHLFVGKEVG
jgi:cytochrome b6-f complex iron-sulfur subunit